MTKKGRCLEAQSAYALSCLFGGPKGPPAEYAAMSEVVFTLCVHWSSDPTICTRSCL